MVVELVVRKVVLTAAMMVENLVDK
jgi:hypothetical protein